MINRKALSIVCLLLLVSCAPPLLQATNNITPSIEKTEEPQATPTPSIEPQPTPTLTPSVVVEEIAPTTTPVFECATSSIVFYMFMDSGDEEDGIYRICADGSSMYPILRGVTWFDVSPNGKYIAYQEKGTFKYVDLTGHSVTPQLAVEQQGDQGDLFISPTKWSPVGAYVAYSEVLHTQDYGSFSVIKVNHIATNTISEEFLPLETYLNTMEFDIGFEGPIWSPTMKQMLLFKRERGILYLLDVECDESNHICYQTAIKPISIDQRIITSKPAWSKDGEKILAVCNFFVTTEPEHGDDSLCIFDMEGNLLQEFTGTDFGLTYLDEPTWSPDNTFIAFIVDYEDIYTLSLEDNKLTNITQNYTGEPARPVWIP